MVIEFIIIFIAIAFSVLLTYFAIPVGMGLHYFVPILLLIVGYIVGLAIMWCVLTLFGLPYDKKKIYDKPSKWVRFWFTNALWYICFHARAKVQVILNKPLPKERFLLVCNHRSKFDPMILGALYGKRDLAFITKPTNFKIPVGGHYMAGACYLAIDRYDKLKSLEVIKRSIDYIKNDLTSIGVFPEGTRSETNEMGPFHEGVFNIALKSGCPIVVTTFMGTEKIKSNFPLKRTHITLNIIDILYPDDYRDKVAKDVSDHCYEIMDRSLTDK